MTIGPVAQSSSMVTNNVTAELTGGFGMLGSTPIADGSRPVLTEPQHRIERCCGSSREPGLHRSQQTPHLRVALIPPSGARLVTLRKLSRRRVLKGRPVIG